MTTADKIATASENTPKVYEAGKQSEYDRFWDEYQRNGNATDYTGAFMGFGWNAETLNPKYDVTVTAGYMMFAFCGYDGDLDDVFKNRGLNLIFNLTATTSQGYMFYNSKIKAIGDIDLSAIDDSNKLSSEFNTPYLETIRNLIPPKAAMQATCWGAGLTNLGVGGKIAYNWTLTRSTKLTHDSLMNVINALADYSTDTSGTAHTLTLGATNLAKLTDTEKAIATSKGWSLA